jgi:serine/threonine protein kinase
MRYRILEPIGRGGVGTVYRAMDEESQRPVAVKVLNTGTMDSVQVRRFEREALALRRLAHPGIAALLDLVDHGTERLMVMELLTGETLDHLVHRQGARAPWSCRSSRRSPTPTARASSIAT